MQIIFEGTPQEILEQIKEYIIRSGYEFSVNDQQRRHEPDERIRVIMPEIPDVQIIEMDLIEKKVEKVNGPRPPRAQRAERLLEQCMHCHGEFKQLKSHTLYCRRNPNRPSAYLPEDRRRMIAEYKSERYGVKK